MAGDYRFARTPRWLVGHVIALVAIVLFANLGMWQLHRLDERRELNGAITAGISAAPVELTSLLVGSPDPSTIEFRRVSVSGTYLVEDEVILVGRSRNGISGHHVLTPLQFDDGTAVVVDRGWVPIDASGPPVAEAAPPQSRVTVDGLVRGTQTRGRFGPTDPATGALDTIARVDLTRLQSQIGTRLAPVFVELLEQEPPQGTLPLSNELPTISEGPHLSYAVQWFIFAGVVLIGYPVLLARTAQSKSQVA